MWGQTDHHPLDPDLSLADASSVYTFTGEPVAKPIEAVLIILGIAWAVVALARHAHGRAVDLVLVHRHRRRRADH